MRIQRRAPFTRRAESGNQHEQQEHQPEKHQRQGILVPELRGDARERPCNQHADEAEDELALEEIERIADILGRDRHRRGGDHDQPDQEQRRGESERDLDPTRRASARAHACRTTWLRRSCARPRPRRPRARAPRRRILRPGGCSRGTCPGLRTRATAAPCRPVSRPRRPHVPRPGASPRARSRTRPRARIDGRRVLADQHHPPNLAAERGGERREILPLALAARDQHQGPSRPATAAIVAPTLVPFESSI